MAFGDVVSSDVVGYDTYGLRGNGQATGVGASFINVDDSDLTLGDIAITGYSGEYADFQIQAKQLDGFGRGGTTYYWADVTIEGEDFYGWFSDDGSVCYNDVVIAPGEGLWIYSPSATFKIQSSGKVPKAPIAVTLRSNGQAKMVSNPMPATLDLGDITVSGYTGEYADFQIQAKKLDGFGRGGTTYYWADVTIEGEHFYGWYNDEGSVDYNTDVKVAAGEGLWVYSPSSSYSIVFPSPL